MKNTILIIMSLFFSAAVSATPWTVTAVETGTDGGFGFSGLHDASGTNVMSGSSLATITGASGTYDDASGAVDFLFSLSNGDLLTLTGNLLFISGWLDAPSALEYTGLGLTDISSTGFFGYMQGDVCCYGSFDPNSFMPTGTDGLNYLTLWGADGFDTRNGTYDGSKVGMDFRLALVTGLPTSGSATVPEPAIIWMLIPALLGLFGIRRKQAFTTAA